MKFTREHLRILWSSVLWRPKRPEPQRKLAPKQPLDMKWIGLHMVNANPRSALK